MLRGRRVMDGMRRCALPIEQSHARVEDLLNRPGAMLLAGAMRKRASPSYNHFKAGSSGSMVRLKRTLFPHDLDFEKQTTSSQRG